MSVPTLISVANPFVASVLLPDDTVPAKNIVADDVIDNAPDPLLITVIVAPIGNATELFTGTVSPATPPVWYMCLEASDNPNVYEFDIAVCGICLYPISIPFTVGAPLNAGDSNIAIVPDVSGAKRTLVDAVLIPDNWKFNTFEVSVSSVIENKLSLNVCCAVHVLDEPDILIDPPRETEEPLIVIELFANEVLGILVTFEPANDAIHVGLTYEPVVTTPLVAVEALPIRLPVTVPVKLAVIVPAEKLPEASLRTIVFAVLTVELALPSKVEALMPAASVSTVNSLLKTSSAVYAEVFNLVPTSLLISVKFASISLLVNGEPLTLLSVIAAICYPFH